MILSRRTAHFYLFSGLCCIVPLVAIAALIWRPPMPISDADELFTAAKFATSDETLEITKLKPLSIQNLSVVTKIVKRSNGQVYLQLHPTEALEFSDSLVYWLPAQAKTDTIDHSATLLGQLSGTSRRQFLLSPDLINASGQLLFYSQGQQQTIAAVPFSTSSSE